MAGAIKGLVLFGAFLCLAVAALITMPWEREVQFGFDRDVNPTGSDHDIVASDFLRKAHHFDSHDIRCEAWVYLPQPAQHSPPVLIMAHGLGAQKDWRLPSFAEQFAKAGYAVFLFDYRHWGGSDGEPRHLVSPRRFVEDYVSAVTHVQATNGLNGTVDAQRIVLWGTSYSGGHSLVTAAKLGKNITAIIAMEPFLSAKHARSRQVNMHDAGKGLRLLAVALSDLLRSWLGQSGAYVKLVTSASQSSALALGVMDDSDYDVWSNAMPAKMQGGWKNLVLARAAFEHMSYNPMQSLPDIQCPVLLVAGKQDLLTPHATIKEATDQLGDKGHFVELDGTHITLYQNPLLIPNMLTFLQNKVPLVASLEAEGVAGQGSTAAI